MSFKFHVKIIESIFDFVVVTAMNKYLINVFVLNKIRKT